MSQFYNIVPHKLNASKQKKQELLTLKERVFGVG
jgi:hypothetical protein